MEIWQVGVFMCRRHVHYLRNCRKTSAVRLF